MSRKRARGVPTKSRKPHEERNQKKKPMLAQFNEDVLDSVYTTTPHRTTRAGGYAKVAYGGNFYNPAHVLSQNLKEALEVKINPVKKVKASEVKNEAATTIEVKRLVAMKYIRLYFFRDYFLKRMLTVSRRGSLTLAQCEESIRRGKWIKEKLEAKAKEAK